MATTPPLHGMRIIECSVLGPAAVTERAGGPRGGRHQGRASGRRLRAGDDVADRGRQLTPPPAHQPRQAVLGARPAHRRRRCHLQGAGRGRRRRRGSHAPRRPGPSGRGLRGSAAAQPEDRVLHRLGLRHDRPVPRLPEPRHRLRHLGGHRQRGRGRRGLHVHPRARVHRHQRRPALRRAGDPGRRGRAPGPPARGATSTWPSPTRRPPSTGTAPRPGGPTSDPSRRSPATSRTTSSDAPRGRRGWSRASATRSTRPRTASTSSSWPPSRPSGRTSARAWAARTSSSAGPGPSTPTTRGATASSSASCATSSPPRRRRSGSSSAAASTPRSPR